MNKEAMSHITTYIQDGWDTTTIYTEKWQAFENQFWSDPTWIPMIAQAIIAPNDQFDTKWAEYEEVLDKAGRREAAVSYTHLDVYKRQVRTLFQG